MSEITGHEYPLLKIFSSDFEYHIPAYQRPYRWGEDNINRLFTDYYDDNEGQYFLGSLVAVEKKLGAQKSRFDIVDGQQRITTLYLLNYLRFILLK